MYAGKIVERADASHLRRRRATLHARPAQISALRRRPRRAAASRSREAPRPLALPPGCPFPPRCPTGRGCTAEMPLLGAGSIDGQPRRPRRPAAAARAARTAAPLPRRLSAPGRAPSPRRRRPASQFPVPSGGGSAAPATVRAVDDVSFEVRRGNTLGLVGESGCGKSTVGRAILQLDGPTSRIVLDGRELTACRSAPAARRREIQMIFQDPYAAWTRALGPRYRRRAAPGHDVGALQGARRALEAPMVGRAPRVPDAPLPARVLGRPAPAHRHRARHCPQGGAHRRRRARLRARRHHPGADREPARVAAEGARAETSSSPTTSRSCGTSRPGRGDVPREDRRGGAARRPLRRPQHPYTPRSSRPSRSRIRLERSGELIIVRGGPQPHNPLPGCHFHPRCPFAQPSPCAVEEPRTA